MNKFLILALLLAMSMLSLSLSLQCLTGFGDSTENVPLDETLPVQLSSFTAIMTNSGFVKLMWTSETETNMLGYNVYRSEVNLIVDALTVNKSIIPAKNSSVFTDYVFTDEDIMSGITYYYWLQSIDLDLTNEFYGPLSVTIVEEEKEVSPETYVTALQRNYPNPFNPRTTIGYSLKEESQALLQIYNLQGQIVQTLYDGIQSKGDHSIKWDGTDNSGNEVGSGIYFYRLSTDHYNQINKMLLVK